MMLQKRTKFAIPDKDFIVYKDDSEEKEEISDNNLLREDIRTTLDASSWNERWLNGIFQVEHFYLEGDEYYDLLANHISYSKQFKFKTYQTMPRFIYLCPQSIPY
jgi:hypothetical protein